MTTIIKPGPTMHYQNNPLSKQLYMYHKPTIKEEPDFSTEYKLRGIGPLVDNNNVNQKEKEKEAKEKETKEKEKLLEKYILIRDLLILGRDRPHDEYDNRQYESNV